MPKQFQIMRFSTDQLDLLEDAISYYLLSGMGGGDRAGDEATTRRILERVTTARERLTERTP